MTVLMENARLARDEGRTAVSHDRRLLHGYLHKTSNTLCGIKGYASLIAAPDGAGAESAQWARKIIVEVEKMERIFRSVGDLAVDRRHPDVGVNLPALLENVFAVCEAKCPGLRVLSGRLPHGELLLPRADLCLVLTELLCNASEGRSGGRHEVRVEVTASHEPSGRLALCLQDNGPGIDSDLMAKITTPFLTTKENHVGVGLTRVETLMDMYGLAWSLTSTPRSGTTVTIEVAEADEIQVDEWSAGGRLKQKGKGE